MSTFTIAMPVMIFFHLPTQIIPYLKVFTIIHMLDAFVKSAMFWCATLSGDPLQKKLSVFISAGNHEHHFWVSTTTIALPMPNFSISQYKLSLISKCLLSFIRLRHLLQLILSLDSMSESLGEKIFRSLSQNPSSYHPVLVNELL